MISDKNSIQESSRNKNYSGRPFTEFISNGFFTVDQNWVVKYWNGAAEKITGVHSKDIVGKNLWEKLGHVLPPKFIEVYSNAFSEDIPAHFQEYRGEMIPWFDVIAYHCENSLSFSFTGGHQILHPEKAELQLKALNQLYRLVTEISNDCLWEWDLQNKEMFWIDGGHKRVFGYQMENALVPQSFWESLLHPDDRERVFRKINKIITREMGSIWEDEYRFKKANGDYVYVRDRGHIIYDADNLAVRMIGATQDISFRKVMEIKLVNERLAAQKELTCAILTAQQNERAEIAKSLHENLNQILFSAKQYVEIASTSEDPRTVFLPKSSDYIVHLTEEIRNICKVLGRPGILLELFESIQCLLDGVKSINPIKIDFHHHGIYEDDLDENLQLDIFRIVQEQLNNILIYANASYVIINLTRHSNEAVLFIADNGIGCDLLKVKTGFGSMNIERKAAWHHGNVAIASNPGEGYELKVILSLFGRQKELQQELSDYADSD